MAKQAADQHADRVLEMVARIEPILHGHAPQVQSAVLADLLASWLAGHFAGADKKANMKLRGELLARHLVLVQTLVPVNEQRILEHTKRASQ